MKETSLAPLISAFPPWHTLGIMVVVMMICFPRLPSMQSLDDIATLREIHGIYDEHPQLIGVFRIATGLSMVGHVVYDFLYADFEFDFHYYRPYSRLKSMNRVPFQGCLAGGSIRQASLMLSFFTLWCYFVEGASFLLAGFVPFWHSGGEETSNSTHWIMRVAMIGWSIAAPCSLLVSGIVKYVLWPETLANISERKQKDPDTVPKNIDHHVFKHPGALLQHNWNSIAALLEVVFLGGMPVRQVDWSIAPLYGLCYVFMLYSIAPLWAPLLMKRHDLGPQFPYPFMDTTMGWRTTLALLGLLLVLTLSHALFAMLSTFCHPSNGALHLSHRTGAVTLLSMLVCRFRD